MNFPSLLSVIITLFLMMIVGYICRKTHVINRQCSKYLSKLILTTAQPCLIIAAMNNAPYSEENLTVAWQMILLGFASHFVMALIAYLICRPFGVSDRAKIFEFSLMFANCAFIGFPILESIFPGMGSFMGAFYVIGFHLFLWTWGIMILGRGRDDIKLTPKKILFNFGTIPCVIGFIVYLCKPMFVLPEFAGDMFDYIGSLCTPVSVLVTGALLAKLPLREMFGEWRLYLHSAIKLLALPMVMCVLAALCGLSDTYVLLIAAMTGVPSATSIVMLSEMYDLDSAYAAKTVGISAVLSTPTLPLVMLFAQWIITL